MWSESVVELQVHLEPLAFAAAGPALASIADGLGREAAYALGPDLEGIPRPLPGILDVVIISEELSELLGADCVQWHRHLLPFSG